MSLVWKFIKRIKWFFISTVIIFFMAFGLSHLAVSNLNYSSPTFIVDHSYFWLLLRITIILLFVLLWPVIVNSWAKKYAWSAAYTTEVRKRRWRYAVWFVVVDLTFQLL